VTGSDPFVATLTTAAGQFIVRRGDLHSIIAGYPWFTDWTRDAMIALPGLTLVTGRFDVARDILLAFAGYLDQGMLPNNFPDGDGPPDYNTVDATLWFFESVRHYLEYSKDVDFVRTHLYEKLKDIVEWHVRGTRFGIHVDFEDGLLVAGDSTTQLTWMDARVGERPVTPRGGKAVEIQALWYNALCVMQDLAAKFGDELNRKRYATQAVLARWSFNRLFWNAPSGCLYDVVNGKSNDASIRPNQIFAVSLRHTMLSPERARSVVESVQNHLLTPYGLRTLAPSDPNYRGRYTGDQASRDGAYHQGTVWPWLLGPFLTAYLKVNGHREAALQQAEEWIEPLRVRMLGPGTGQMNEIFEGDVPHGPVGCIAQAWSVAELLRASVEDLQPEARPVKDAPVADASLPLPAQRH